MQFSESAPTRSKERGLLLRMRGWSSLSLSFVVGNELPDCAGKSSPSMWLWRK